MDSFLPKGFEPGRARSPMKSPQRSVHLCVEASGVYYPVLRYWSSGFAVAAEQVPALRGVVTLYDGAEMLHQCLITGSETAGSEVVFAVKKSSRYDYGAATEIDHTVQPSR